MKKGLIWFGVLAAIAVVVTLALPPQEAESLGALSYKWTCYPNTYCNFTVTSSSHAAYRWNFGDGTLSSCSTSKDITHSYSIPPGEQSFNVSLIGYNSTSCSSPDNIVGCSVTAINSGVGGHPPYSGTCP